MWQKIQHFLFAPLRPYPTTAPIHYQLNNPSLKNLWGWKPFATILYASGSLRQKHTHLDINERIIEIPWIFSQIDFGKNKKGKVLDVGWLESTVGISLATAGFQVTGIDIRKGELTHPNFRSIQGDICQSDLPSNTFDYVILLSTVEHIGLDTLYGKANPNTSDQRAINECLRVLKPGGKLLITTPVAKQARKDSFMRVYTPKILRSHLKKAKIQSMQFFASSNSRLAWNEVSENNLPTLPSFGVALIAVRKGKT